MNLVTPQLLTGFASGVLPAETVLAGISTPRRVELPEDRFTPAGDSLLFWSREFGADAFSGTIVFDSLPLLEVDGATVRTATGKFATFTSLTALAVRIIDLSTGTPDGAITVSATTFPVTVGDFELGKGGFLWFSDSAGGLTSGSSLEFGCVDVAHRRIEVLMIGTESAGGGGSYYY